MGSRISTSNPADHALDWGLVPTEGTNRSISQLPDDALSFIFLLVARAEPIFSIHDSSTPSMPESTSSYTRLGWLRLSSVCRRWRALLVSLAPLWANIVFHLPPQSAALALSRAKEASLNIRIPSPSLPSHVGRFAALRKRVRARGSRKGSGQSQNHRERLLTLAVCHAPRMGQFYAEDLTLPNLLDIFRSGSFSHLRVLVLKSFCPEGPSYDAEVRLHIIAPRVEQAHLSITLPITHNGGPGLKLSLPALRDLEVFGPESPVLLPRGTDRLRWIPDLIRGAVELRSLIIYFPDNHLVPVNWTQLFGAQRIHVSALCAVRFTGSFDTRLDQLYWQLVMPIPSHISFIETDFIVPGDSDRAQLSGRYGETIAQSLRVHPLDSLIISRGTQSTYDSFDLTAFSHIELPGPHLMVANLLYNACTRSRYAVSLSARMHWGLAEDTLDALAPFLTQNTITHLILDEHITDRWMRALRRFVQSCLPDVTTLHCTHFWDPIAYDNQFTMSPCKTLLRLLEPCAEPVNVQLGPVAQHLDGSVIALHSSIDATPQTGLASLCSGQCLPALETLVISMSIPVPPPTRKKHRTSSMQSAIDTVNTWWSDLVQALSHRCSIGLRVRTLCIVGGWASEEVHRATAEIDARMFAQTTSLVDEVVDERAVGLIFTYDSSKDVTLTFSSSERVFPIPTAGAW